MLYPRSRITEHIPTMHSSEAKQHLTLDGVRVLVVEDEFYIADDLCRALRNNGAVVVGPCPTLRKAEAAINSGGFDCVILDLNLHGDSTAPIADELTNRGVPFVIATGYGSSGVPNRLKRLPQVEKPFEPITLVDLLSHLMK